MDKEAPLELEATFRHKGIVYSEGASQNNHCIAEYPGSFAGGVIEVH